MKNKSLYDEFYGIDTKDYKRIYKFYGDHADELESRTNFEDKDDFNVYMLIMAQYVVSLENLEKHFRATVFADKLLPLIVAKASEYQIDLSSFTPYRSMLASKGRSHYVLKEFRKAEAAFKILAAIEPENINFQKWHYTAKSKRRKSVNKYLFIAAITVIIIAFMFGSQFNPPTIKLYLLIAGFALLWIMAINSVFFDLIRKLFKR